jgi:hypothetical protein
MGGVKKNKRRRCKTLGELGKRVRATTCTGARTRGQGRAEKKRRMRCASLGQPDRVGATTRMQKSVAYCSQCTYFDAHTHAEVSCVLLAMYVLRRPHTHARLRRRRSQKDFTHTHAEVSCVLLAMYGVIQTSTRARTRANGANKAQALAPQRPHTICARDVRILHTFCAYFELSCAIFRPNRGYF